MRNLVIVFSTIMSVLFLSSCGNYAKEKDLEVISLNMDKQEVMAKMSTNGTARGSIINKFGQTIEVREYKVDAGKSSDQMHREIAFTIGTFGLGAPIFCTHGEIDTYWLYFCDGKLVQWGKAGDWAEAQRMIYDINFNTSAR